MPSLNGEPRIGKASQHKPTEYKTIAAQWAKAKAEAQSKGQLEQAREVLNSRRRRGFEARWRWTAAFWIWMLVVHAVGIWLFTGGFLLSRLVLEDKASCANPPAAMEPTDVDAGCWHPRKFERAVVIIIDALRYDFTVPQPADEAQAFHNAFPFLHQTAVESPRNAFLLPFIADPPTATLQRLKGLTTGTLPTFVDAGSNFAGTAVDEDNLLLQLREAGKKIAHLGDDTWWALFPGFFEANISRAYDSFNVWDLHTVDDGVAEHVFPLLEPGRRGEWDVLIGHCLGVDHAGHRYGPDHPAMTAKLAQMDGFVARLAAAVDEDTLLVVMGDHGMDSKGDHGGESDDEVEAALWMYSKRPLFGRTGGDVMPPATAKERPVNQIDLVPTLALLLGIPIPYNNLGKPIEEAFAGPEGDDWANLAAVSRIAAAGIERYQRSYFAARGMTWDDSNALAAAAAEGLSDRERYRVLRAFEETTLETCKGLWTRFDVPRMVAGVAITALGVLNLLLYCSRDDDGDDEEGVEDDELDHAERKLELLHPEEDEHPDQHLHSSLLRGLASLPSLSATAAIVVLGASLRLSLDTVVASVTALQLAATTPSLLRAKTLRSLLPSSPWSWLAALLTLGQAAGFASNSYTVWEDSILLFLLATFGAAAAVSSMRIPDPLDRALAVYHSVVFVLLSRAASYSKLCREEQMPRCASTYYGRLASSTSSSWQLALPFVVCALLPSVVKSYLVPTRSHEGLSPTWLRVWRGTLLLSAAYWLLDALEASPRVKVLLAQLSLALSLVAGTAAFVYAPPSVSILTTPGTSSAPSVITILGYANAHGARYLLLPLNLFAACALLSKPMGAASLALMLWQVLSLAELTDRASLRAEPVTPVVLALLGNFYFFRTGHQATPSSIQWDAAFVPLSTVRYPWTPLVVLANTFAGQILAAAALPLLLLWKVGPRRRRLLETLSRGTAAFLAVFAVQTLASMACAAWLRRHLMLYRVFCPRFLMAAALLLVLDLVCLLVTLAVRANTLAVSEVFGWAD